MNTKKTLTVLVHAIIGWVLCFATMGIGMATLSMNNALIVHAIAAPVFFSLVSWIYFQELQLHHPFNDCLGFCRFCDRDRLFSRCAPDQQKPGHVHQPDRDLDPICFDICIDLSYWFHCYKKIVHKDLKSRYQMMKKAPELLLRGMVPLVLKSINGLISVSV